MTPLDKALQRAGYVRLDEATAGQAVEPVNDEQAASPPARVDYPQVVMIQGRSPSESWVRDHAGQLLLAAGVGVFALASIVVVALVTVAVMITAITGMVAIGALKAMTSGSQSRRGRWSR